MSLKIHFKHRNIAPVRSLGVLLFFLLFSSSTCDNPQCLREELDELQKTTQEILNNQKNDGDALKDIKDRLTAIEQKLGTLSPGDLDGIKQDLSKLQNQFNQLNNAKADKSAIDDLKKLFSDMQTQISDLETWKSGIEAWKTGIDSLQTAFNDLKAKQEGEIKLLQTQVQQLESTTATNKAELETQIKNLQMHFDDVVVLRLNTSILNSNLTVQELSKKLGELEQKVDGLTPNLSSIPSLKTDLQNAKNTITTLTSQIDSLNQSLTDNINNFKTRLRWLEHPYGW